MPCGLTPFSGDRLTVVVCVWGGDTSNRPCNYPPPPPFSKWNRTKTLDDIFRLSPHVNSAWNIFTVKVLYTPLPYCWHFHVLIYFMHITMGNVSLFPSNPFSLIPFSGDIFLAKILDLLQPLEISHLFSVLYFFLDLMGSERHLLFTSPSHLIRFSFSPFGPYEVFRLVSDSFLKFQFHSDPNVLWVLSMIIISTYLLQLLHFCTSLWPYHKVDHIAKVLLKWLIGPWNITPPDQKI